MLKSKPNFVKKYNYVEDTLLTHSKIGAILFHFNTRKSVALEVTETGFEVETIDNVINELNERSQDLFFNADPE